MPNVQIDRVTETKPVYDPPDKKYKVFEFICDGYIDGAPTQGFTVKTLSGRAAEHIKDGLQFDGEVDERNGRVSYKIPKAMYSEGGRFYQSPQNQSYTPPQDQPQGGSGRTGHNQPNPTSSQPKVSFKDLLRMHKVIYMSVVSTYNDLSDSEQASITATLFIECNKKGIQPPKQEEPPPPPPEDDVNSATVDDENLPF